MQSSETVEARAVRNQSLVDEQMERIKTGGVQQEVEVVRSAGIVGSGLEVPVGPVVEMYSDGDPFYVTTFRNANEVDELIGKLQAAKQDAFG